jgi:ribosomal protein S18 acetylase RimI-like enzyme
VPLKFRPIHLERDRVNLINFARDLFAISFGRGRFEEQFESEGSAYIEWIAKKQSRSREDAAFALLHGKAVGMVVVGPWHEDVAVGYLFHCYLAPDARGLGLAGQLDVYAVSRLRTLGHCSARLSVAQSNLPALRFYEKHGWTVAGPRRDQPGIIYMERKIARPEAAVSHDKRRKMS